MARIVENFFWLTKSLIIFDCDMRSLVGVEDGIDFCGCSLNGEDINCNLMAASSFSNSLFSPGHYAPSLSSSSFFLFFNAVGTNDKTQEEILISNIVMGFEKKIQRLAQTLEEMRRNSRFSRIASCVIHSGLESWVISSNDMNILKIKSSTIKIYKRFSFVKKIKSGLKFLLKSSTQTSMNSFHF